MVRTIPSGGRSAALWLLACCAQAACSDDAGAAGREPAVRAAPAEPRSADPRLVQLRHALEFGRLDLARTLLAQVGALAGAEAPLLKARMAVLSGDGLGALRELESARQAALAGGAESSAGAQGRVHACAAEIYAILERFDAAATELQEGLALAGPTADLLRANGVLLILQPGGAAQGLEKLEQALALDPATPFLDRALSQAHLLEGRRALVAGDVRAAWRHARKAAEHDPDELDVKELEAECRQVLNDFDGALELLRELAEAGRETQALQADLHQRAATYELFHKNRTAALDHYRQARELGLDDAGLGFGATLLAEEADLSIAHGIEAYADGDLAAAKRAFADALEVDTGNLEARNHLAVVLFREQDYAGAADLWAAVLERALEGGIELPEPVELNLARAQKLAGRDAAARGTVEGFLERAPEGEWAVEAREMLRRL
jgi:tetratricopeptide (TPR) repeat protein